MPSFRGSHALAVAFTMPFVLLVPARGAPAPAQGTRKDESAATATSRPQLPPTRVEGGETQGVVWTGEPGITETVAEIMDREAKLPIGALALRKGREHGVLHEKAFNPEAPAVSQWPPADPSAAARVPIPKNPQTVGATFLGVQLNESFFIPPDTIGDVGPTQVLIHSNGRIKVFDKLGALGGLNATDNSFWSSVRNGAGVSDPHVRYDRLSGRWFVTIINLDQPNRVLIAVSSGSTITNASSFTFFQFQHDLLGPTPNADTGGFADYDTLGVDKFALYIGANIFDGGGGFGFTGTTAYVVKKADLIANTLTVTAFRGLIGGSTGIYTPQGVQNDDPNATEGYFIGVDVFDFSELVLKRVTSPGGTPSISGDMTITVPTTRFPILQDHAGVPAGRRLDSLDDRLFAAQIHTNKITGVKSLWTAHNIEVNSSGVGTTGGGRNGSRWYQIGSLTTTPTLVQSGTLFDPAGSNPFGYWIPSVGMSGQGHMAIGASRASADGTNGFARIGVAGRLRTDTAGTTQAPTLAQTTNTAYLVQMEDGQRWGDYSQTVVDPTNDQTMWTFQEYCNATDSWGVRAIQLKAPAPATPSSASPASVCVGQASLNVAITGTSSGGTEFFDPGPDTGGPGFANHIAGAVSGSVTVNSTTFNNPAQVTLNVSTVATPAGTKNVTITNPDGRQATGNNILTVSAPATSTVGGTTTICAGASTTVQAALTGTGPWNVTWSDTFNQTVSSSPAIHTVTPGGNTIYTVTSVSDACGAGTPSGSTTVNIDNDANCGGFFTVTPCRVVDTRAGQGPALAANSTRTFEVVNPPANCGIPIEAKAVTANLTVVDETTQGNLRLFPAGGVAPFASTINFVAGQTRANNAIVPLGPSGQVSVLCTMATGSTNFVLDVTGYFR